MTPVGHDETTSDQLASRPDAIQMTGAAAAGAAVVWSGSSALADSGAGASVREPLAAAGVPTGVIVTINGKRITNVTVAGYAESEVNVLPFIAQVGTARRYRPGNNKIARIKITRGWSTDATWIDWYSNSASVELDARQFEIVITGAKSVVIVKLSAVNVWPFSWCGPAFDNSFALSHAVESITLSADSFEYS
jgi:hypothetical protein